MTENKSKILNIKNKDFKNKIKDILRKDQKNQLDLYNTVFKIIQKIQNSGNDALINFIHKLDNIKIKNIDELYLSKNILKNAYDSLKKEEKQALNIAAERIKDFHIHQIPVDIKYKDDFDINLGLKYSPISSAGFYVPGGKAIYPSSVLMNAIPALVAGVERRVVVSPVSDLNKSAIVLAAAYVANVTEFICMGGAHAIAALAYGTETVMAVDKIVGPGNAYVAEAKRQVFGKVGIDSIAGPSEVLIVCDKSANPNHVAIDLLSQAEHDELAQAILITDDEELALKVEQSIKKFLTKLPRSRIASSSWNNFGAIILVKDMKEAIKIVNFIAPEHLQLIFKNAKRFVNKVKNAGAIFVGPFTPEAVGDYIAGPNHVLPTSGTAKFSSGLGVLDFYKKTTIVNFSKKNLNDLGKHVVTLAKAEGLDAHAMSVSLRLNK